MSEEDIEQSQREWMEMNSEPDGNLLEDEADDDKEVIDLEGAGEKKRKQMASRSEMWDHFSKIFQGGELVKGKCNYCGTEIQSRTSKNGTSALKKHYNCCKRNPHVESKQGVISISQGTVGTWKFDAELLRFAFAEMIIEDEEPFALSEKPGFVKFMSVACLRFTLPSRRTCTRDCVALYTLSRKQN
jgi:ssDNA-binding Zn-finger/Zn-ribbon topoisomerase 1